MSRGPSSLSRPYNSLVVAEESSGKKKVRFVRYFNSGVSLRWGSMVQLPT